MRFLNSLAHPRRVFSSFEEAWDFSKSIRGKAHDDSAAIAYNFAVSSKTRISDYPVLFWLSEIAEEPLSIFDFGGGIGQLYYHYMTKMNSRKVKEWLVNDLPYVVDEGEKLAAEKKAPKLKFTKLLSDCKSCNVLLASGALHFYQGSIHDLDRETGGLPEHVIINRSPFRLNAPPFVTVTPRAASCIPFISRNPKDMEQEFSKLGFALVDQWTISEKTFDPILFPDHHSPYLGFYFRKAARP